MRQQVLKNGLLNGFAFGRGLNDQVGRSKVGQCRRCRYPAQGRGSIVICDQIFADLPSQVPVNQVDTLLKGFFTDVGHFYVISGQGEDMGNPIAHLTCSNDAHLADCHNTTLFSDAVPYAAQTHRDKAAKRLKTTTNADLSNLAIHLSESAFRGNRNNVVGTMKHETVEGGGLHYAPCRYGMSRIFFRGPRRRLDSPYVAFLGGTETFGKFIDKPIPALVEKELRQTCVNFGCVNGGVDAFVNDPTIMAACHDADMTVVQIMGANYLSNRFYSVHPRRNDRFLRASTVMQAIFNDVDFSDFTFTRHMLGALYDLSADRFDIVVSELREAWVARMKNMLGQIGPRVVLFWFSKEELSDVPWHQRQLGMQTDPLFITEQMINELRPLVMDVVVSNPSEVARAQGTKGMFFTQMQQKAASEMLGVACHQEAATTLIPILRKHLAAVA